MDEFVAIAFGFPTVVFTAGILLSLMYWLFVMLGALDLDLGADADVGDAGVGDAGAGDAGMGDADIDLGEGDFGDGDVGDDLTGAADVGEAGDGGGGGAGGGEGALAALLGVFSLRKAPITISLSLLFLFGWLVCYYAAKFAAPLIPGPDIAGQLTVLFASLFVALPLASLTSRPIGKLFVSNKAPSKRTLVGKVARVRVHADPGEKGQATLDDGSGSLLRVRADSALDPNARVLLVDYDEASDTFEVEAMDSILHEKSK
ncbi:MAG: hypothetical protein AAGF12_03980 [Myxococcota bacterium]